MKRLLVDILLLITILLEFSRMFMKPVIHEILGVFLIVLVILHLILNKNYIKNIFKYKYNLSKNLMLTINICFMLTFILSLILGLLSSQELFPFLNINNLTLIKFHKMLAYFSLIFLGLHLGINFKSLFEKLSMKIRNKNILHFIELIIIISGIYLFIKLDILKHLIGKYGFSLVTGNLFINVFQYFLIIMSLSLMTYNLYILINNKKEEKIK